MSNYLIRSPKPCSSKQINHGKLFKKATLFISVIVSIVMIIVIVLFTLHPSKTKFSLQEADIYKMNLSSNYLLSSVMQVTVVAKNPNQRVGIYYDNLEAYVVYRGQPITVHSSFAPFYQGHDGVNVLSSWMSGNSIPVSPSFGDDISIDRSAGKLQMNVKLTGRVRWKVCTWASGHHSLEVDCDAFLAYNANNVSGRLGSNSVVIDTRLLYEEETSRC
ncbi:YLS9 protein [Nymphaea thermarum]|nr:YLS9 protein [Nymphaea thermarum]